jgi:heavy metal translocating P-type ATPase
MNSTEDLAVELEIGGMHCAGCASRLEGTLRAVPGVVSATVNFATGTARIQPRGGASSVDALLAAVSNAGFQAAISSHAAAASSLAAQRAELQHAYRRWLLAAAGFLPLAALSMSAHAGLWRGLSHVQGVWILEALVSGAVVFAAGAGIIRSAVASIGRRSADMDTLVGFGAVLAWAGSIFEYLAGWVGHHGSYFEAAAGIVTFALLGRWLEARARSSAGAAIQSLAELQPGTAHVERDGKRVEIPVSAVVPGMVVLVAPGERIPVDGELLEGQSGIDESWVTGESVPVTRKAGDAVVGGTINGDGALRVRVTAAGRTAFLEQVVAIVREAQATKPPIQRAADAVSKHFSVGVLVAALVTVFAWGFFGPQEQTWRNALWHGLSVLVVACPCALGLATPVAVLVGSGAAAKRGILFRSGEALESLSRARVAIFDKTGTLTAGRLEIVEWWEREYFQGRVLGWVAAAEQHSVHPVARAVVVSATAAGAELSKAVHAVEAIPGRGLRAQVDGHALLIGHLDLLRESGVLFPESDQAPDSERIWVAVDGEFAAWFRVADRLRPEAPETIRLLQNMKIRPVLLTGDHAAIAARIAAEAGIDEVRAGVRPDGKRDAVLELQKSGDLVVMVGDGINDAPALAQADVGVAMGGGTAVARQTADITLMRDDLSSLLDAILLSRRTLSVIRQNLAFAFGYNLLAIPLAAGVTESLGWSPGPVVASAAMALSSVSVVLNALRLRGPNGRRVR